MRFNPLSTDDSPPEIETAPAPRERAAKPRFGPAAATSMAAPAQAVVLTPNAAKRGIELHFNNTPPLPVNHPKICEATREVLKDAGWRWSRFGNCWFIRDTPENRAWATDFIAHFSAPPVTPQQFAGGLPPAIVSEAEAAAAREVGIQIVEPPSTRHPVIDVVTIPAWRRALIRHS
jgi:hypothetical protein